jgi:hypothetical protein
VTFYGDCVKMREDFVPNFGDKNLTVASRQRTASLFHFQQGFFFLLKTTWLLSPTHSTFLCFPGLNIKLKGRHFSTVELTEAEAQAVLNSLTEHDFQDSFKNVRSAGNDTRVRGLLLGWCWLVGPELAFIRWQHQSRKLWMTFCIRPILSNDHYASKYKVSRCWRIILYTTAVIRKSLQQSRLQEWKSRRVLYAWSEWHKNCEWCFWRSFPSS